MTGRESATDVKSYLFETFRHKIKEDIGDGFATVIGGDFNEDNSKGGEMNQTLQELEMVNVTSPSNLKTPATHASGSKTIDHIWVSKNLIVT